MRNRDVIFISHWTDSDPPAGFSSLARVAAEEGHHFLERFHHRWLSGERSFSRGSECLYVAYAGKCLAGIVGVGRDARRPESNAGCLQVLYVDPVFRGQNLGYCLLQVAMKHAMTEFNSIALDIAASGRERERLSQRLGFHKEVRQQLA
jgi:GNAT superfamily N-acetyltransferase